MLLSTGQSPDNSTGRKTGEELAVNMIKSSGNDDNDAGNDDDNDGGEDKDILFFFSELSCGGLINTVSFLGSLCFVYLIWQFIFSSLASIRHRTGLELFDIIERMSPT